MTKSEFVDQVAQDAIRARVTGADVLIHLEPEGNVRPGTEIGPRSSAG